MREREKYELCINWVISLKEMISWVGENSWMGMLASNNCGENNTTLFKASFQRLKYNII